MESKYRSKGQPCSDVARPARFERAAFRLGDTEGNYNGIDT